MRSLRGYLVAMATLLVLLLGAATALILHQVDSYGRVHAERQLIDTTRAMSLAIDGQMRSYESLLLALRQSEALQRQDWAAFDAQARQLLSGSDAWIVVGDATGQQKINTHLPVGARMPRGIAPEKDWRTIRQGRTVYCNLTQGYSGQKLLCVVVPVMRGGQAVYALAIVFRPALLDRVFAGERLRAGRFVTVLDRNGVIIWRNIALDRYLGYSGTSSVMSELAHRSEGAKFSVALDGTPTLVAFSRSEVSGWTSVVGLPRNQVGLLSERSLGYGMLGAALFLLIGAGVGLAAGRRVAGAIDHLNLAATRLRNGAPPAFQRSGLAEVDAVGEALDDAVHEREATQERLRLAQEVGGIGVWEWDLIADVGRVSESYRQMHGLAHVEGPLRMAQVLAVIHPDDLEGYRQRFAAAGRRTRPWTNEYRVVHANGAVRWIYTKGRPQFAEDGTPVSALGVAIDLTERKETEERLRLLMREVDHRANNLMAVIQGTVALSRGADTAELRKIIIGRVDALARAHQLLAASRWSGADLRRLVEEELRPYALGDEARVSIEGPPLPLSPAAAQGVAMALHELATNAAKHGALSVAAGRVQVAWTIEDERLKLCWTETGGPRVTAPIRSGFGATVLQRALGPVGGRTHLHWRGEGLVCELELPLPALAD